MASKEITREEVAATLHAILEAPGGSIVSDPALREELERVTSDIPYAADREAAFSVFTQRLLSPEWREEIGRAVLPLPPVVGEVVSAVEVYEAFSAALEFWRHGDTHEALRQAGEGGLATLGALPLAGGAVRLTRGGIKIFRKVQQLLKRGEKIGRDVTPEISRAADEAPQSGSAARDPDKPRDERFPDREMITDTEYPFMMIRRKQRTTNRKLRKEWEEHNGKKWPIDPDTGRRMEVHHVVPLADGGADHISNIVPLMQKEHKRIHKENEDHKRWEKRRGKRWLW